MGRAAPLVMVLAACGSSDSGGLCPPFASPDRPDPWGDAFDANCDGADGVDADGDGAPANAPEAHPRRDCDDTMASVHPAQWDRWDDTIDSDCDGTEGTAFLGAPLQIVDEGQPHTWAGKWRRVGDMTGDGIDDFANWAAAPPGDPYPGTARWLLLDGAQLASTGILNASDAAVLVEAVPWPSLFIFHYGETIPMGDLDGDGRNELVISEPYMGTTRRRLSLPREGDPPPTWEDAPYYPEVGEQSGIPVGDWDGDGLADLAFSVGAQVRIYPGGPGPLPDPSSTAGASLVLSIPLELAGGRLATLWDHHGPGLAILGPTLWQAPLLLGVAITRGLQGQHTIASEGVRVLRIDADDVPAGTLSTFPRQMPYAIPIGDVDGDGLEDVALTRLMGSSFAPDGEQLRIWPAAAWASGPSPLGDDFAVITFPSEESGAAGARFARLGDVDGDGRDDILSSVRLPSGVDTRIHLGASLGPGVARAAADGEIILPDIAYSAESAWIGTSLVSTSGFGAARTMFSFERHWSASWNGMSGGERILVPQRSVGWDE